MDFKVIFKETFLADLESIVGSIAVQNPVAALKLGTTIVDTSESLSFLPERYPTVHQRPGIRRFVVGKHFKVFYRVLHSPRIVEVLRCWDGRRGHDPVL